MDNNKLGLKIVRINQGYTDLFEINGDQVWTKNVWDIRKDLENIDNLDGSSAVLMLTSVDTGHILTVASLIEGRITDCISAWIYVPASINIAGKELVEIVDAVKKEILANERNDERLTQLLSKTYESAPASRITTKSNGEKCAFRYYGQGAKYTLSELLKDMCQSYYKSYKSVFLLDNSSKLKCLQGDNLSDQKVYSMVVVKSPGNIDSFVPYIGERPFVGQIYAIEGGTIDIEWRRDGYMPIHTKRTIAPGAKYSVPTPNQYVRVLNYNYIKVVDEWSQRVTDYDLYVAKQRISKNEDIRISEATLNNVWVEIHAEGFEPISDHLNLTQPVQLKLVKETVTENGYVTRNDKNYLRFKPFTRKFWITCLICSIIVLLLGVCGGYALNDFIGGKADNQEVSKLTKENTELKNRIKELEKRNYNYTPKGATNNNEDYSLDAAVSYLDNNNKWNRTEMEKFDDLKGLWDALNERLFDDIIKYEAKLKQSVTFSEVLQAVKANKHKNFAKPYSNDYDIRIHPEQGVSNGYINALNVVQASSSSKKGGTKSKKQEDKKDNKPTGQGDW